MVFPRNNAELFLIFALGAFTLWCLVNLFVLGVHYALYTDELKLTPETYNPDFPEMNPCGGSFQLAFIVLSNGTVLDANNESRDLTKYWNNQTQTMTIQSGVCSGIIQEKPRFK